MTTADKQKQIINELCDIATQYEALMEEREDSECGEDDTRCTESIDEDIDDLLGEALAYAVQLKALRAESSAV